MPSAEWRSLPLLGRGYTYAARALGGVVKGLEGRGEWGLRGIEDFCHFLTGKSAAKTVAGIACAAVIQGYP